MQSSTSTQIWNQFPKHFYSPLLFLKYFQNSLADAMMWEGSYICCVTYLPINHFLLFFIFLFLFFSIANTTGAKPDFQNLFGFQEDFYFYQKGNCLIWVEQLLTLNSLQSNKNGDQTAVELKSVMTGNKPVLSSTDIAIILEADFSLKAYSS